MKCTWEYVIDKNKLADNDKLITQMVVSVIHQRYPEARVDPNDKL